MAATEINARWQGEMSDFFEDLDGAPDEGFIRIPEIFHLEDQPGLHDIRTSPDHTTEK